ncbi:O-antigen polymerase [Pseudotamlana carrageenivorans]|nr:O-antigen polymerase [Tamlana carrageenivorans]
MEEAISLKTILFIVFNVGSLVLGFISFNFINTKKELTILKEERSIQIVKLIIKIVLVCYILRYIDLLLIREMSLGNNYRANRELSFRIWDFKYVFFAVASVLKSLYFFPIIICISLSLKNKPVTFASYILLLFPLLEALLRGTRKPFFDIVIIIIISIVIFTRLKLNLKKVLFGLFSIVVLFSIANIILFDREASNSTNIYEEILNARYNDFLKPNQNVKDYILDDKTPEINKRVALTTLHVGQYLTHGFFEFNNIIKSAPIPLAHGGYTFNVFTKILKTPTINTSPRNFVYITFFGGLFLDFGWFSILLMFLFGIFQKYIFQKAIISIVWRPLLVYILIINVFLLMFNYIRGSGVYPIIGFLVFFLILKVSLFISHEKSANS